MVRAVSIALLLGFSLGSYAQRSTEVVFGLGIPETLHLGFRTSAGDRVRLGMTLGTFPAPDNELFAIAGDLFYHFGGQSRHFDRRPWYVRGGLSYLRDESSSAIYKDTFLNTRAGREMNINTRFGMYGELGLAFNIIHTEERKTPSTFTFSLRSFVYPGATFGVFYRFVKGETHTK